MKSQSTWYSTLIARLSHEIETDREKHYPQPAHAPPRSAKPPANHDGSFEETEGKGC